MKSEIATATQVFLAHPNATEAELITHICAAVGDHDMAERLIEFVPLAFGRVILDHMGVKSPDSFIRMLDHDQFSEPCPLDAEPVWRPALAFAKEAHKRMSKEEFFIIAGRSAEVDAVTKACAAGSDPRNLVGSPPILLHAAPMPATPRKPWWQLWK